MNFLALSLSFSCLFALPYASAREPADINQDVVLKAGQGKQEAFDEAIEQATLKLAGDLVGPEKIDPVWPQIKAKLLKNSARYVLFIRGSAPVDTPEGQKLAVQLRLAPDGLETLLREFGLFNGASVRVLPLVTVTEPRGSRYAWWAESSGHELAREYFKHFLNALTQVSRGKSIYVIDPSAAGLRLSVPASYRVETLRREEQMLLAQYLKADVVLTGRLDVAKAAAGASLNLGLDLWQARTGRGVAEASRAETVASEAPKVLAQAVEQSSKRALADLTAKLTEAAAGGQLNLNVVRVATNALAFKAQAELKRQLGELREIRAVRERLFEPGRVTYEVETPLAAADLAKALQRARLNGFSVRAEDGGGQGVILTVRPVSSGS